ncbi:MAG TPA: YtxH domain-containing protein [Candidatus Saccharimonadales bacterium]|nr:YtxH domain-containing protein [Candidatus Saccharimonadales bacterium]
MRGSHKEDKSGLVKKLAIGAAITGLIGYIAGLLTAPKSGKETREAIKDKAYETYGAAEKELKKLHTELSEIIEEVSDKISSFTHRKDVSGALDRARDAKQKAREVLSTLHEGQASDKDLKKAISDATNAIEHLRDFLRK